MKMHYYFFLEVNTGPHSCIWWLKYNCEAPGEGPLRGGGFEAPGEGPLRGHRGASNSLAPALMTTMTMMMMMIV